MRHHLLKRKLDRRGSASVEFALIAVFFLLPLLAGAADFIIIITAQAQLNTALQSLLYYSWTNQSQAASNTSSVTTAQETALITAINSVQTTYHITLNSGTASGSYSNLVYACVSGTGSGTVITPSATSTCGSGQTVQTYVQFSVSTSVALPFPLPLKLTNPVALSATGAAQVN